MPPKVLQTTWCMINLINQAKLFKILLVVAGVCREKWQQFQKKCRMGSPQIWNTGKNDIIEEFI
jgi:hypothetical protein